MIKASPDSTGKMTILETLKKTIPQTSTNLQ
jgi:hypothetical protein